MSLANWPTQYRRVLSARLLLSSYFFVPYIALYARELHITLGLLLVIESIFALLTVLFDLPAGHLADRIGPRQALLIGGTLEAVAALLLGALPHAFVFWSVQPLFAGSQALTMGADAALSAGVLRRARALDRFEDGERLFQSLVLVTTAVVLVLSSALSLVALRTTFLATAVVQLGGVGVLLTVGTDHPAADPAMTRIPMAVRARGLIGGIRRAPGLGSDLLAIILTGTAFSVLLYLMPLYYVAAGLTEHWVGLAAAAVASVAAALSASVSPRWPIRVLVGSTVVASALLSVRVALVILIAAVFVQAAQATLLPRYRARVLADLHSHGDATAMSIVTTSRNIGFAVLAPFLGLLAVAVGIGSLGVLCALLFLVGGVVMSAGMVTRRPPAPAPEAGADAP